jgi:hypothetical protein
MAKTPSRSIKRSAGTRATTRTEKSKTPSAKPKRREDLQKRANWFQSSAGDRGKI